MNVNSNGEAPPEEAPNTSSSSGGGVVSKIDPRKARRHRRRRKVLQQTRSLAEELTYNDSSSDVSCSSDSNVGAKRCREEMGGENLHGKVSVIGRRREMEDAVAVELGFMSRGEKGYDFFGVYDCHGGWRVAQACSERGRCLYIV